MPCRIVYQPIFKSFVFACWFTTYGRVYMAATAFTIYPDNEDAPSVDVSAYVYTSFHPAEIHNTNSYRSPYPLVLVSPDIFAVGG